jgi:hypothetical protein
MIPKKDEMIGTSKSVAEVHAGENCGAIPEPETAPIDGILA